MLPRLHVAGVLFAFLTATSANCTPLVVAIDGHSVIVATNAIDTEGNTSCKLHFSKSAVVMQAAQAASMKFTWPDGHTETLDFEADLNNRIRDLDEPIDNLKRILIESTQTRIRSILQR